MAQYMHMHNDPDVKEDVEVLTDLSKTFNLVLFDDDVHTFDDVIHALIVVCGHDPIQAEQCTLIVHFKGKCAVKSGDYETLEPMCTALHDRGLTAEIQP
jgi:ATP-dependent Clp protease adaptor protein ClpS